MPWHFFRIWVLWQEKQQSWLTRWWRFCCCQWWRRPRRCPPWGRSRRRRGCSCRTRPRSWSGHRGWSWQSRGHRSQLREREDRKHVTKFVVVTLFCFLLLTLFVMRRGFSGPGHGTSSEDQLCRGAHWEQNYGRFHMAFSPWIVDFKRAVFINKTRVLLSRSYLFMCLFIITRRMRWCDELSESGRSMARHSWHWLCRFPRPFWL